MGKAKMLGQFAPKPQISGRERFRQKAFRKRELERELDIERWLRKCHEGQKKQFLAMGLKLPEE